MRVNIIPIGNSKGIRIPKSVLEQCGFEKSAELEVEAGKLVLRPRRLARAGWEEAAKHLAENRDDQLLETPAPEFDERDWQW
jgi:antitoxin MazE